MVVVKNEVYSDGGLRASEEEGAAATAAAAHPRKGLGGGDGGSRRTNSSINIPHAVEEVDFNKSLSPTEGKAVLNPDGASRWQVARIEDRGSSRSDHPICLTTYDSTHTNECIDRG